MEFLKVQLMRWKKNIEIGLNYDVPHISTYVLTVEPKTALKKFIENNRIKEVEDTGISNYNLSMPIICC